jgi:hypothetical protein
MRRILTAVLLLTTSLAFAQTKNLSTDPEKFEFGFNSGGKLRMELGAGDADIIGGKEDKIIITYTTSKPEQAKNVRVEADLRDTWGTLKVHGPHNNFRYTIQVPAKTNLYVRMSAGDLEITGIEGHKDVESHAGDLKINLDDPRKYGEVDASVRFGDLNLPAFNVSKGGIGRSWKRNEKGEYRLHAHLGAGDLTVR